MISKTHFQFKPLLKSLIYFSSVGASLLYLGFTLKDFVIGTYFLFPGAICLALGITAGISLFSKNNNQYYGVFSLKTQKMFRVMGILFPWLFIACCCTGYFLSCQIKEKMLVNRGFQFPWQERKYINGYTEADMLAFAEQVSEHYFNYNSKNYRQYTRSLMHGELGPSLQRNLKQEGRIPASEEELERIESLLKENHFEGNKFRILKAEKVGFTRKENFLIVRVKMKLPQFEGYIPVRYHLGFMRRNQNQKPVVADMIFENPQW